MALPGVYLLVTNIIVALVRQNDLGRNLDAVYDISNRPNRFRLCVVSIGECLSLETQWGWGAAKRAALRAYINACVVIGIEDPAVLTAYAEIDS